MPYIDFAAVKEAVSIGQAVERLGLRMTKSGAQLRGACPACKAGGDRVLVVTPAKGLFICFANNGEGGDQIALTAHVRGCSVRDAAEWLGGTVSKPVPVTSNKELVSKKDATAPPAPGFQPLSYLDAEHPAVETVGFDPETAQALGIGYASKGILRGTVAVPIRLEDGSLAGYIGITEAKLPPKFHLTPPNVVSFPKKTA